MSEQNIKLFSENQVIGHRGAAALAPENTLAGFNKAYELGCRFIEFDVMLNADGDAFVFHDTSFKRTTNGRGEVGLASTDYLQSLDAGKWFSKRFTGERIPTLHLALDWLTDNQMQANIEIKPYPGFVEQTTISVLMHINRYWPSEKSLPLVSSFNFDALTLCHRLSPEMPLGLLLEQWRDDWLSLARSIECVSVHLAIRDATKARIQDIKQQGFAVCVYTVNRKRLAQKLFNWSVDAVFSDYPDLL